MVLRGPLYVNIYLMLSLVFVSFFNYTLSKKTNLRFKTLLLSMFDYRNNIIAVDQLLRQVTARVQGFFSGS